MSASKRDRTVAPRVGSRASRAKHTNDRNVKPPAGYRRAGKPKKGERVMDAQLAVRPSEPPAPAAAAPPPPPLPDDEQPPPRDPWWADERERCYQMVLQGLPQHQIAAELNRDRHTVARWCEDDRFVERLQQENEARFRAMRQRRAFQTVRLTDKAHGLATKMLDKATKLAEENKDDLGTRLAARDWLQEFRENSRREDEIYGLDRQHVDVNVHGTLQHQHRHKGSVDVSFKAFLTGALRKMGVDPETEEIDAKRADDALVEITERALLEGSFLDDLVEHEKDQKLAPMLVAGSER